MYLYINITEQRNQIRRSRQQSQPINHLCRLELCVHISLSKLCLVLGTQNQTVIGTSHWTNKLYQDPYPSMIEGLSILHPKPNSRHCDVCAKLVFTHTFCSPTHSELLGGLSSQWSGGEIILSTNLSHLKLHSVWWSDSSVHHVCFISNHEFLAVWILTRKCWRVEALDKLKQTATIRGDFSDLDGACSGL